MREEAIEFADLVVQDTYGRSLSENEKKFLRQVTKDTHLIMPRQSGRNFVSYMIMAGLYYETITEGGDVNE